MKHDGKPAAPSRVLFFKRNKSSRLFYLFPPPANPCKGHGSAYPLCLQPPHHPPGARPAVGPNPAHRGDAGTLPTRNKSLRPSAGSCCPQHTPVASGCWRGAPCPPAHGWQGSSSPFPDESVSLEHNSSKGMICSYSLLMNF